jgi:hypothetical protein
MIINDHDSLKRDKEKYIPLPYKQNIKQVDINSVYHIIKKDIHDIIEVVLEEVLNDPAKEHIVVRKK